MDDEEDRVGALTLIHQQYGIPDARPEWLRVSTVD